MCHFAVHDLAWDLLHDYTACSDVRRRAGVLYLAFSLTGDCTLPDMAVIRPLLVQASEEESEAATQLQLVRMIVRTQKWWRSLRLEVRSLLTSLCRSWLGRDVDLTLARSARCLHLSDEILFVMREAGVIRRRPSPGDDGTWLDSWAIDDDQVFGTSLPTGPDTTKRAASRPADPVGDSRRPKIQDAKALLIAEQLLKKFLAGQPLGEADSFALACLWWTTVVSVEFAVEEVERVEDGSTAFGARLMSASFVLGMSLGLDWNRLKDSAVRRLIETPTERVVDTTSQLFLVRVLLRDVKWWHVLRAEIRAMLERLCFIWTESRRNLRTSSRRACLALCEELIADQYELNDAGEWSDTT